MRLWVSKLPSFEVVKCKAVVLGGALADRAVNDGESNVLITSILGLEHVWKRLDRMIVLIALCMQGQPF